LEKIMEASTGTVTVTYRTIETRSNVLVNIPSGKFVRWMDEFVPDGQAPVPGHWQHGTLIQEAKVIVNDHYFDIDKSQFGTRICATVEVVEKDMGDGRVFILRNIHPSRPDYADRFVTMKFRQNSDRGISIPGTNFFLQFNWTASPAK
jgi:hypothetical protein